MLSPTWQRQLRRKPKYTQAPAIGIATKTALSAPIGAQLMGRQDIAHLESQYSWAQIRLAAYSQGSRPSAQVPAPVATLK